MITQVSTHGETFLRPVPGVILVASKSEPGAWHHTTPSTCDCKGFQYRRTCRHIGALRKIVEDAIERTEREARAAAIAETVDLIWPE